VDSPVGRTLGPYEIQYVLGSGGLGTVYRGVQRGLNRPCAVTVFRSALFRGEASVRLFEREATIAARLNHPNIIPIYDIGEADGFHYIAMQLVKGNSLRRISDTEGPLSLVRSVKILSQLANALDYAHERGIVHGDLKSSNVMVGPDDHVTLIDFGLVRGPLAADPVTGDFPTGTPEYMAPEAISTGAKGPSTDDYALGVVADELLTSQVPFRRDKSPEILFNQVSTPPPSPRTVRPDLLPPVGAAILPQLSKDPRDRYESASAFVAALIWIEAASTEASAIEFLPAPPPGGGPPAGTRAKVGDVGSAQKVREQRLELRGGGKHQRVSVAHPRSLSKRITSPFSVYIFPEGDTAKVQADIARSFREWKAEEHDYDTGLKPKMSVVIALKSEDIKFSEPITKELKDTVNSVTFAAKPSKGCSPGIHAVVLSITEPGKGAEYVSMHFCVKVVDYAFGHVSRPFLSNVSSAFLGAGSLATFSLTFLGQMDKTFGLASGTVTATLATAIYSRFFFSYRRPNTAATGPTP
jgi:serine/threonine-protein kinase